MFPLLNLTEDKDGYYVRAELPARLLHLQVTMKRISSFHCPIHGTCLVTKLLIGPDYIIPLKDFFTTDVYI
jgi:hypothetical protein